MRGRLAALALILGLLLTGCAAGERASASEFAPEEGERLVVYTSHKEEVYWPIIQEFEARTGIWVEVEAGGTSELLARLRREADAPAADVMFGGGVDSLEAYQDCFSPYVCAGWEGLDPAMRSEEGLWTPFSALPVVIIYNTKLVVPGQITGWRDLFSPAWQGRIAFCDPRCLRLLLHRADHPAPGGGRGYGRDPDALCCQPGRPAAGQLRCGAATRWPGGRTWWGSPWKRPP